ncbi:MAG: FecR domain-containing protein [Chitinophagaceae bacterium]
MSDALRLQLLFSKYLQRSCSPQEVEELVSLLGQAEAEETLSEHMRLIWEELKNEETRYDVDWNRMYESVSHTKDYPGFINGKNNYKAAWWKYAAAASVIFIIVLSVYWGSINNSGRKTQKETATLSNEHNENKPASNKQTIHLPDGSTVILNTGSKLNYPSAFSNNHRDVYLYGEGFFDIQHDAKKPFIVHVGKISVKVLGTAFNIKTNPGEEKIEVTVTRGKVQVLNENKNVGIVTTSEQLSYNAATEIVVTKIVDTIPVIAWKPAEIYFNDITMEEAAQKIEKKFGKTVEFENSSSKNCRVTATFSEDDTLEEILTVICAVSKTEYIISTNKITINGKGCN